MPEIKIPSLPKSQFVCCACQENAGVGYILKRKTYCNKCGEIALGLRDKTGKAIPQPEPVESLPIEPGDNSDVVIIKKVVYRRDRNVRRKQS